HAGAERDRRAYRRHRASPQRHFIDPRQRRGDQRLYIERQAAGGGAALCAAALRQDARRGGAMTRLKINGVDEEVAATTIAQLLNARGIDPGGKFLADAIHSAVVRRAGWGEAALQAGDAVEIVRPLQGG